MKQTARPASAQIFFFWLISVLIIYFFLEFFSLLGLWSLRCFKGITFQPISKNSLSKENRETLERLLAGRNNYFVHSPKLGWTIKPNGSFERYRANDQGIRASHHYELTPAAGVIRIAAFGDSFTHGDEVRNDLTWEQQLEQLDKNLEVLNFGVSAYGLDQAFLRYEQDGAVFHPKIVLIGFLSENIYRNINVFRPFYGDATHFPLAKPRFILRNGNLSLLENPLLSLEDYKSLLREEQKILPRLGMNDDFYHLNYGRGPLDFLPSVRLAKIIRSVILLRMTKNHPIHFNGSYNPDSEAFQLTVKILEKFYESVIKNGSIPVIVLFPERQDIEKSRKTGFKKITPLIKVLEQKHFQYIDLLEAFDRYGKNNSVSELCGAHYTPLGNEIVAKAIDDYLKAMK